MAKLTNMPSLKVINGFKKTIDFYYWMGIPVAREWPRKPDGERSPAVREQWPLFVYAARLWQQLSPVVQRSWNEMATGTALTGRDLQIRAYIGGALKLYSPVDDLPDY